MALVLTKERVAEIRKENFPTDRKLDRQEQIALGKMVLKESCEKLYSEGMGTEEISKKLNISEKYTKKLLGLE